jgi:hypothetical protein
MSATVSNLNIGDQEVQQLIFFGFPNSGLLLSNGRSVDGIAIGCHIVDADGHHIAAAQLAVDGQVKEGKITRAPLELEARSN